MILPCSLTTQIAVLANDTSSPTNSLIPSSSLWIQYGNGDSLPLILYAMTGRARRRPRYNISQPEHDDGGEGTCRQEDLWAPVMAGCNTAPILEPSETVLDPVAAFVEFCVVRDRHLSHLARRDAWHDPLVFRGVAEPIRVMAAICEEHLGVRQIVTQGQRIDVVAALAAGQEHPDRSARRIGHGMQLRFRPTIAAPNQAAARPFSGPARQVFDPRI